MNHDGDLIPIEATGLVHPKIHRFHPEFVNGVIKQLSDWVQVEERDFADGTKYLRIGEKPRTDTAIIIGWPRPNPDTMWRLKAMSNALLHEEDGVNSLANRIMLVSGSLEGRGDHNTIVPEGVPNGWNEPAPKKEGMVIYPGEAIGVEQMAQDFRTMRVNDIFIIEPHSSRVIEYLKMSVDRVWSLTAIPLFAEWAKAHVPDREKAKVFCPDKGSLPRGELFGRLLELPVTRGNKFHPGRNQSVVEIDEEDDLTGTTMFIVEDTWDTLGTLTDSGIKLKKRGVKKIYVFATTAIGSGPAIYRMRELFEAGVVDSFVTTNNHPHADMASLFPQVEVVDVIPIFTTALRSVLEPGAVESNKYGIHQYLFYPNSPDVVEARLFKRGKSRSIQPQALVT